MIADMASACTTRSRFSSGLPSAQSRRTPGCVVEPVSAHELPIKRRECILSVSDESSLSSSRTRLRMFESPSGILHDAAFVRCRHLSSAWRTRNSRSRLPLASFSTYASRPCLSVSLRVPQTSRSSSVRSWVRASPSEESCDWKSASTSPGVMVEGVSGIGVYDAKMRKL